jgi:hypothetical protein
MENAELYQAIKKAVIEKLEPPNTYTPPEGLSIGDWFVYKAKLATKKSAVRAAVKRIPKNGTNHRDNYKYAEAADIFDHIREIMHENQLGFDAEPVKDEIFKHKEGGAPITKVYLQVTWTDLETGYFEQQKYFGYGLDYGDKGPYKAYIGTAKYVLVLNFLIPTGDDPERDNEKPPETAQNGPQESKQDTNQGKGQQNGKSGQNGGRGGRNNNNQPQENDKPKNEQPEPPKNEQPPAEQKDGGQAPNKITSEQVGKIKKNVLTLAAYSTDSNKKTAQKAIYDSLTVKMRSVDQSIPALDEKEITGLTFTQANFAIEVLEKWLETKKPKEENDAK